MNRFFKITAFFLLISLSSCLSVKISSIHSDEKINPIKKIFVTLLGSKNTEIFYENLRFGLYDGFNKRSIQSSYYVKRALSLETDQDVKARIEQFNPDQVLTIDLSDMEMGSTQIENTAYSFDIRLTNLDNTKILWRATLDLRSSVKSESAAKQAADAIIAKMAEDGLFGKN